MADKIYRVGIIGCGGMGGSHTNAWKNHPRTEVIAAMDIDADRASAFAEANELPAHYTDFNQMFAQEDLDIVSITTWQSVRLEPTLAAAEAGLAGIITEKPISASVGEANDMVEACDKNGTKLVVGHQRRFSPQNSEARRLIQEGAIGQPQAMLRRDGLGLLNRGTHEVDEMRYILGDPKPLWLIGQVSRKTDKWERRVRCEDRAGVSLIFLPPRHRASSKPPAFAKVSSYSISGSESATMPAPTWKCTWPSRTIAVRMAMLNWLSRLKPR